MLHSVFLSVENIIINQIIFFYNIFQKYDYRNFYFFKYKNIRFAYFKMSKTLYIQTEVDKILGRNIITLKDKNEFLEKIKEIIKEFVNIADEKLHPIRLVWSNTHQIKIKKVIKSIERIMDSLVEDIINCNQYR